MSLSFCPFFFVLVSLYMYVLSQLYPQSYLICICSLFSAFMSIIGMCSNGLGVRVEDSLPRGQWFKSPLEQFVLKTRALNSILRNRNMIGKIPTRWENSDRGNRKTVGKIPLWWEISLSGRKKVFRCIDHLVLQHPSYTVQTVDLLLLCIGRIPQLHSCIEKISAQLFMLAGW